MVLPFVTVTVELGLLVFVNNVEADCVNNPTATYGCKDVNASCIEYINKGGKVTWKGFKIVVTYGTPRLSVYTALPFVHLKFVKLPINPFESDCPVS